MNLEHVTFHYMTVGHFEVGEMLMGWKMCMLRQGRILPLLNYDDVPTDESYQSILCFQEVINEKNEHWLVYFSVHVSFVGGVEC